MDDVLVADDYAARIAAFEEASLSPLAARSYPALRAREEQDCGLRTPFQRDRAAAKGGFDRGGGVAPRGRPPAVRAHRRGGAGCLRARALRPRLPAQRA